MKDVNCISDTETYTPKKRRIQRHKDDFITNPKQRKVSKLRRKKTKSIINVTHSELIRALVRKNVRKKKYKKPIPGSSYHGSCHNLEVTKKCKTVHENISVEINNPLENISNCKSLHNMELEKLEVTSLNSKRKSIDDITSQIKRLNF